MPKLHFVYLYLATGCERPFWPKFPVIDTWKKRYFHTFSNPIISLETLWWKVINERTFFITFLLPVSNMYLVQSHCLIWENFNFQKKKKTRKKRLTAASHYEIKKSLFFFLPWFFLHNIKTSQFRKSSLL